MTSRRDREDSSARDQQSFTVSPDQRTVTIRGFDAPQSSPQPVPQSSSAPVQGPDTITNRRPSFTERLGSLGDAGGLNSFNNFAASWRRAAGFYEITQSRSFSSATDAEAEETPERFSDLEQGPRNRTSLLRAAIEHDHDRKASDSALIDEDEPPESSAAQALERVKTQEEQRKTERQDSIFHIEPSLASPYAGSPGSNYGSLISRINEPAERHAGKLFARQQETGTTQPDKEREPLLTKRVQSEDGLTVNVVVGQSTLPQTIFNSVNTLIGVGMLSLPLALRYGGWLIGMIFFFLSAVGTSYTARLLAKCLNVDNSLVTFADLAYAAFGHRARIAVSLLFMLELIAACVALIVLFADSINLLVPALGLVGWKIFCGILLIPLSFLPLRFLSFTSILGILCCVCIVIAVFIDGFVKPHAIGSLRDPSPTYIFPEHWGTLPLSFGLFMAPWGGHSVFPNIYRDMRHPQRYPKAVKITYVFTYFIEVALAIAGYLMFGEKIKDEVTSNIFLTDGYPKWLSYVIVIAIIIIPITKIPLNARPVISTIEIFCGLDVRALPGASRLAGMSGFTRGILKVVIRIVVPIILVAIAIGIPEFDRIMSFLGSLACFSICIILPCSFHLKIFGREISAKQRFLDWSLLVVCSILAVVGTVCAFLPKKMLGAE